MGGLGKPTPVDPNNMFPSESDINSASRSDVNSRGNSTGNSPNPNPNDVGLNQISEKEAETIRLKDEGVHSKLMVLTSSKNTLGISDAKLREQLSLPEDGENSGSGLSEADKSLLIAATKPQEMPVKNSNPTQRESDLVWYDAQRNQASGHDSQVITHVSQAKKLTIFEGSKIPAVTTDAISSDLPGQVTALVRENVYDGIEGKTVLIPKGSRVVGAYNNNVSIGQTVVQAAFNRIIFPNGQSINIGGMPASGAAGQAGLSDKVNTHFWKIFGSSFLIAGVAALVDNSNRGDTVVIGGNGPGQAVTGAAGTVLSDTSRTILQRNVNLLPTIEITQGYRFNISVTKDISIPAYTDTRP